MADTKRPRGLSRFSVLPTIRRASDGNTRFRDVFLLITAMVIAGLSLALFRAIGLRSQNSSYDDQVRKLREEVSAMTQRLSDSAEARLKAQAESRVPHPALSDRDANVIGDHTNVSWTYMGTEGKYVSYEIELVKLKPDGRCFVGDFLNGAKGKRFIATDPQIQTSRIPQDEHTVLAPGTYVWRVAAVPTGAAVVADIERDDPKRLSEWSSYATFTIYPSVMARIVSTGHIRVGTNLEQNTRFGRRAEDGNTIGFDISLVHLLIEGCLRRDALELVFDSKQCGEYIKNNPSIKSYPQAGSCEDKTNPNHLCYDFIPVAKWGDWQSALRRKEIDLFAGGVTASKAREGRGIRFTRGYLSFTSRIYARSTDLRAGDSLSSWLSRDRVVGVVSRSSNEAFLDQLVEVRPSKPNQPGIIKMQLPTYPALESAMDHGDIDGVLLDETFVAHDDWKPLTALDKREQLARRRYITGYVGNVGPGDDEQVAIAVADDVGSVPGSLLWLLNNELDAMQRRRLVQDLCGQFWPKSEMAAYKCRVPYHD